MAGICSRHQKAEPDCRLCQSTPADLFGKASWEAAKRRAKEAGTAVCPRCGFTYYSGLMRWSSCQDCPFPWGLIRQKNRSCTCLCSRVTRRHLLGAAAMQITSSKSGGKLEEKVLK